MVSPINPSYYWSTSKAKIITDNTEKNTQLIPINEAVLKIEKKFLKLQNAFLKDNFILSLSLIDDLLGGSFGLFFMIIPHNGKGIVM